MPGIFSNLDLSKGYWQIPINVSCQSSTACITEEGFAFRYMLFGLVNSGARFCHMRTFLRGMEDVENFVDNILEHSETWESHINMHT